MTRTICFTAGILPALAAYALAAAGTVARTAGPSAPAAPAPPSPVPAAADGPPHHRVRIEGAGASTVVLEAGLGDTLDVWQTIQPRVADHCARTFAYNRAGYADSDPAEAQRDAASIVAELREELRRRNLRRPTSSSAIHSGGCTCSISRAIIPATSPVWC